AGLREAIVEVHERRLLPASGAADTERGNELALDTHPHALAVVVPLVEWIGALRRRPPGHDAIDRRVLDRFLEVGSRLFLTAPRQREGEAAVPARNRPACQARAVGEAVAVL